MWAEDSDNNISDNALTLNLQAYGSDAFAGSSSEELCIDSGPEDDSGSPIQRNRKRKRSDEEDGDDEDDSDGAKEGDMPDVVLQMEAEIERQLDAKAKRSNLTVANVKSILKDVITNEQVLDLVRHTMKQPEHNFCINKVFSYAPKLTRSKTRELLNTFPSMAWPITPSKNISTSKCKVLIEQELPEDSSDEEYQPDEDYYDYDDTCQSKKKCINDEKDEECEEEEVEEQADSDEIDVQGDEEEEEDDDEEDEDDEEEEDGHDSDQNTIVCKQTESDVKCLKRCTGGEEEEEEEDDDDDDCRLVICDNDNEIKEGSYKNIEGNVKVIKAVKNTKRTVIYDTGTQTSWPEGTEKRCQNKVETADSSDYNNSDTNEENICHRTRSKFSLSDTPLEAIESAFIPPDITTDMYDSECDDEDWKNFLKGFTQPLKVAQEANDDDDDDEEIDPEYNIMADEEETDDKEELREDPGVKVSRKEVNALMAELFEYIGMLSDENDGSEKLHRNGSEFCNSYGPKNNADEMEVIAEHVAGVLEQHVKENAQEKTISPTKVNVTSSNISVGSSPETAFHKIDTTLHSDALSPTTKDVSSTPEVVHCNLYPEQKMLIKQHIRQYVQFLTQHFLLSFLHPLYHVYSMDCKQNLSVLKNLAYNNKESVYYADNLDEAIALIENWEQLHSSESSKKKYIDFMDKEIELQNLMKKRKQFYRGQFPPGFSEIVVNSSVFIYPLILPTNPFRCDGHSTTPFFESEDQLIAMGLEYFMNYTQGNPKIWGKVTVSKIVPLIVEHFLPARRTSSVHTRILECSNIENNPIKHFFTKKSAPKKIHYVIPCKGEWIPPCQQPLGLLPKVWRDYMVSKTKDCNNYVNKS